MHFFIAPAARSVRGPVETRPRSQHQHDGENFRTRHPLTLLGSHAKPQASFAAGAQRILHSPVFYGCRRSRPPSVSGNPTMLSQIVEAGRLAASGNAAGAFLVRKVRRESGCDLGTRLLLPFFTGSLRRAVRGAPCSRRHRDAGQVLRQGHPRPRRRSRAIPGSGLNGNRAAAMHRCFFQTHRRPPPPQAAALGAPRFSVWNRTDPSGRPPRPPPAPHAKRRRGGDPTARSFSGAPASRRRRPPWGTPRS